jgi:hypothetical protein
MQSALGHWDAPQTVQVISCIRTPLARRSDPRSAAAPTLASDTDEESDVRRAGPALRAAAALAVVALLLSTALAGLRSPTRTEALASELAAAPIVQELVADALIAEVLADAELRLGPVASLLLPIVRPGIERFIRATVSSPAGQAALASALTDTIRQLSVRGPTVVDLRAAVEAALAAAPEDLAPVLRALLDGRDVGRLVLGAGEDTVVDVGTSARAVAPGTIAGLPSGIVVGGLALLAAGLLAAVGRRAAGTVLLAVALPTALLLWFAPEVATGLLGRGLPADDLIGDLAPLIGSGIEVLLAPVRLLAGALAALGAVLLVPTRRASL